MNPDHQHQDLGRRRGLWIPDREVEDYLANGWSIADPLSHDGRTLLSPPAEEQGRAA